MSNVIPIVSASPPPMDDGAFDWDGDDCDHDDFGNFSGGPELSNSASTDMFPGSIPEKDFEVPGEKSNNVDNHCDSPLKQTISETEKNMPKENKLESKDDFADFANFNNSTFSKGSDVLQSNNNSSKDELAVESTENCGISLQSGISSAIDPDAFYSDSPDTYIVNEEYSASIVSVSPCGNNCDGSIAFPEGSHGNAATNDRLQHDSGGAVEEQEDDWSGFNSVGPPAVEIENTSAGADSILEDDVITKQCPDTSSLKGEIDKVTSDTESLVSESDVNNDCGVQNPDFCASNDAYSLSKDTNCDDSNNTSSVQSVVENFNNLESSEMSLDYTHNSSNIGGNDSDLPKQLDSCNSGEHVLKGDISDVCNESENVSFNSFEDNAIGNTEDDCVGPSEEVDEEFGNFGSAQTEAVAHDEVTPISFRTTVCDSTDRDESDEAFGSFSAGGPDKESSSSVLDSRDCQEHDDFGDFGAFDSANSVVPQSSSITDDDDFGEFGNAGTGGGADWADFGAPSAVCDVKDSDNDDFDDFTSFENVSTPAPGPFIAGDKLEKTVCTCFPPLTTDGTEESCDLDVRVLSVVVDLGLNTDPEEVKQQTWSVVQHPSKKDPAVMIWTHLQDLDSSHALTYTWPSSHCCEEVFNTLHIDTKNVLFTQKKQSVPFFNSGLSILEPTRGASETKKEKKTTPPVPNPTVVDTSVKQDVGTALPAQDIPPVDFDWMSSGLTNPLTANTLDLDFLVVHGGESSGKTSDEWDWVFKADNPDTSRGLQSLEDMMRHSTPTARLATQEVLSPEAEKILEKMPNLSFMQSKVLMFPVKQ